MDFFELFHENAKLNDFFFFLNVIALYFDVDLSSGVLIMWKSLKSFI